MASYTTSDRALTHPISVEEIVKKAKDFEYNPHIPFKYWIRSAGTLLKEADIYEHEGNDQQTYLLLYRHAELVVRKLSVSPEAKQTANRDALSRAQKVVEANLQKLEVLKPRINKRHERYQQLVRVRNLRKSVSSSVSRPTSAGHGRQGSDPRDLIAPYNNAETLTAGDNRDLAVQLARKEMRRRATARKATRQAGISEEVERERRGAGLWGDWEEAFTADQSTERDALSKQLQGLQVQIGEPSKQDRYSSNRGPSSPGSRQHFNYPTAPTSPGMTTEQPFLRPSRPQYAIAAAQQPPSVPPKTTHSSQIENIAPLRPEKTSGQLVDSRRPSSSAQSQAELHPSGFTFKAAAFLENGTPLRTIFLPPELRHHFLKIAEPNTRANLETCGILCGTLISNALFISKLVIPEQESTSDTCETVNESDLFDYVDGEDLIVLGWIHTHPTQTCFMSSRDLHTHGGYQVMLPESVAIVCAPSKGDWGVFRLTDPPGIKTVLNCTQSGLFHPHSESHLYTDALRPGHVFEARGLEFEVVDLRPHR